MPGTSSPDKPSIDEAALDAAFEKASPVSIRNKRGARKLVEDYLQACNEHSEVVIQHEAKPGSKCPTVFGNKHSDGGKGYGILQCTVCGKQVLSLDHECTKTPYD